MSREAFIEAATAEIEALGFLPAEPWHQPSGVCVSGLKGDVAIFVSARNYEIEQADDIGEWVRQRVASVFAEGKHLLPETTA